MDPAGISYSPKSAESPQSERKEPRSPRPSIRRNLFPQKTRLQDVKVAPSQRVWTEKLQRKVGEFVKLLSEAKAANDVTAAASTLIEKSGGLTPGLSDMVAAKLKELPDQLQIRILHRIRDLLAVHESRDEIRSLLKEIERAADLGASFDTDGQTAMNNLVAGLGSKG